MSLEPDYPILTERLALRPFTRGDVDAVHAYRSREDVAAYLFDGALSHQDCADAIHNRAGQTALRNEGDKIVLAVVSGEADGVIGEISLIWRSVQSRQAEVGWIFHPDFHGRGYATEAVTMLLDLAFLHGDIHRVMARCDVRNTASEKLMTRLGMRREAHFRQHEMFKGTWGEEYVYAILAPEWRERVAMRGAGIGETASVKISS